LALTLRYNIDTSVPVDVERISPDRLREKPLAEIERLEIHHGNRRIPLAELFTVSGDSSDGQLEYEGDVGGVHCIGHGMTGGMIRVMGDAGRHLGAGMTGGTIRVEGHAGDWAGAEMHGGLIQIRGDAGDMVGAAYRGSRRGMTDGTILVGGNVGDEVGAGMRRGMVAVGGSCGDAAGFNMIAGSILVFGDCGIRIGAGMKRGTIGLFGNGPFRRLPTFRPAGTFRPLFLRLILRELKRLGFPPTALMARSATSGPQTDGSSSPRPIPRSGRRASSMPAGWSSCPAASTCIATSSGPRSTPAVSSAPSRNGRVNPSCAPD
jgi:formylmethanofuran dehydrogenase subunit C